MLGASRLTVAALTALTFCTAAANAQAAGYVAAPPSRESLYADGQTGRYLLGGTWLYRADPRDLGTAAGWWRDRAQTVGWTRVSVPNSFNAGDLSMASWNGSVGWYRRDFTTPSGAFASYVPPAARLWIVRFESVNYRATVWLNGRRIGAHVGEGLPFELDLGGLRKGVNRLVVRADNRFYPGALPPGPGGGWWNYGGILREVYLRPVRGVDLAAALIRPTLPCLTCPARVEEDVSLRNLTGARAAVRLTASYGSTALDFGAIKLAPHASAIYRAFARIEHPHLWSINHPALYRATITLTDALGRTLAGYVTYSGIRVIRVTPDGRLTLNGRPLSLRGVEIREQDQRFGAALDPAQLRWLVGQVKALGATVIRAAFPDPEIEEMADREGLLIWSDIPVSAAALDRPEFTAQARTVLTDDIAANENHPSVLLWSIANELPTPATAAETAYVSTMTALAHHLDPTRPVGMAVSDWPGVPCQRAYGPLDVIGVNEYFGWYDAGGGSTDDRDALGPFLDTLRSCYPRKALMISEFGFDGARNGQVEVRGTYQFQANAVAYHLAVFASKRWLSGAIYFLLQNSVSVPTYTGGDPFPAPPLLLKGLLDFDGHRKPAWSVVASVYRHTVQIAHRARIRHFAKEKLSFYYTPQSEPGTLARGLTGRRS